MTYRVIQWATGTVGVHAVPAIAAHPDLELAGLWVHSDAKAGRDAGELCGVDALGVTATQDAEALLASDADCICYMAHSDVRPGEVIDDISNMLAKGHNVVNTSFVPLLFPKAAGPGVYGSSMLPARRAAPPSTPRASIRVTATPASRWVPLALCKEVRTVRMMEIVNYATWDNPPTMFDIMGFGKTDANQSLLLSPGSTAMAWGPVVAMVAAALDIELDEITEWHEVIMADEPFDIASGRIDAGTISGMRFEIRGMVRGEPRIVVEHVTRLRDSDAPTWPTGQGYRILIEGEPHVKLELELSSDLGDHNHAGCLVTAMHVINAIPDVCDADPGVLTFLDLPVYSARHLMR